MLKDDTKKILMTLTDSLNQVAENIALLSRTLLKEDALQPPAFVVAAQEVLDAANATMDKAIEQNEEATLDTTEDSEESFVVGSQVKYVGDRESLKGQLGIVREVKERGWLAIAWHNGDNKSARTNEVTLFGGQGPEEVTSDKESYQAPSEEVDAEMFGTSIESQQISVEAHLEDSKEPTPIILDEEAASYHIPKGLYAKFSSIHHIYKAGEKERKWLRIRARRPLNCETTQLMVQRYLSSVQDAEYLAGVSA